MTDREKPHLDIFDLVDKHLRDQLAEPNDPHLRHRREDVITQLAITAGQIDRKLVGGMLSVATEGGREEIDQLEKDLSQLNRMLGKYSTTAALFAEVEDNQSRETRDTGSLQLHERALTFLHDHDIVHPDVISLDDEELESLVATLAHILSPFQPRLAARDTIKNRLRDKLTLWSNCKIADREGCTSAGVYKWWMESCDIFKQESPRLMDIGTRQQPKEEQRALYTLPSLSEIELEKGITPYDKTAEKWTEALGLGGGHQKKIAEYLKSQSGHIMTHGKRQLIVQARNILLRNSRVQTMLRTMDPDQRKLTLLIIATRMEENHLILCRPTTLRPLFQREADNRQASVPEVEDIALGGIYRMLEVVAASAHGPQ